MFSRLARPKIFATGATDVKVTADLKFFYWRERITCVRRPIFFVPGATEVKVPAKRSFFGLARAKYMWSSTDFYCAWRDWKFLRRARSKSNCPPTACFCNSEDRSTKGCRPKSFRAWRDQKFLRLARTKQKWPSTEIFAPGATENFCVWRDQGKTFRWPHFFATEVIESFLSKVVRRPKIFCVWRDRKLFDWRDRSISFRRQKSICDWRDRSTIDSLPHFFCNWGDCSTNERGPKCFHDWRVRKFLRQARPT